MSRAEYMREYRARRKAMAATLPPGTRVVMDDELDAFYLARIAELEAEVRNLKAELAMNAALALPGAGTGLAKRGAAPSLGVREGLGEPPSLVTADGTQGMRRGVSDGRSRSSGDGDAKR